MNEEMTLDNPELTELALRPHWAIGLAEGYMQRGAQLCTHDGRRMGTRWLPGSRRALRRLLRSLLPMSALSCG
jgi:hypothetical protein